MKKLTKALHSKQNGQLQTMEILYLDDDRLQCSTPLGTITIDPDEEIIRIDGVEAVREFWTLIEELRKVGLSPYGCFSCRYFTRSGMQVEAGGTIGNCIEGKMNQILKHPDDLTLMEWICEAYHYGAEEEKAETQQEWSKSIHRSG